LQAARSNLSAHPDFEQIVIPALERIQRGLPFAEGRTDSAADALDAINDLYAHFNGWRAAYYYQAQRLVHLQAQETAVRRGTAAIRALYSEKAGEVRRWNEEGARLKALEGELDKQTAAMARLHANLEDALRPLARRVLERFGLEPTDDVFLGLSDTQRIEYGRTEAPPEAVVPAEAPLSAFPLSVDDPRHSGVVNMPSPPDAPPVGLDIDRRTLTPKVLHAAATQTITLAEDLTRAVMRHVETVRAMERAKLACGEYNGAAADWAGLAIERQAALKARALASAAKASAARSHSYFRIDALCELARNGLWAYLDLETSDLTRLAGVDAGAARSMASYRELVTRFAREGLSFLPAVVREVGSLSPSRQERLEASMKSTVCGFARDIELEAAQAPSFLKPLFAKVVCR
jgi:hypothetical protein